MKALLLIGLLTLTGCYAAPYQPYAYQPAYRPPMVVAPVPYYGGWGYGGGWGGYRGGWGHGGHR